MIKFLHSMAILALVGGCTTVKVTGDLDGEEVPIQVAMFLEDSDAFGGDGLMTVVLSSEPNACRLYEYFLSQVSHSAWRSYSIAWQKTFPENFWEVALVLRTASFDGSIEGQTLEGLPWDAVPEATNKAYARTVHYVQHPSPEAPDNTDWYVEYFSNGGSLTIDKHDPGEVLKGTFSGSFVDPTDGAERGSLDLSFEASVCPNIAAFGF